MQYPITLVEFESGMELFIPDPVQVKPVYESLLEKNPFTAFPFWAKIWASSKALSFFLQEHRELIKDKHILEVGAGIGLPSFTIAPHAASVIISDHNADAVNLLEKNIRHLNFTHVKAMQLDWNDFPENITADVVLLSDVNYAPEQFDPLLQLMKRFLQQGTLIILSTPQRIMASPFVESLQEYTCNTIQQTIPENGQEIETAILLLSAKPVRLQ